MIWIIGGTSEGQGLLNRIKDIDDYIVSIATEGGKEFINTDKLFIGRLNKEEMEVFVREHNIDIIVDLSHPYAKIVSDNARETSKKMNINYLRYVRKKTKLYNSAIYLDSYEESYKFLRGISGTVFFTTGSKNIGDFEKVKLDNRFIYRILPALESIEICVKFNVAMKDIIAVLGPFSKRYNKIMFEEYKADYVIMKDSGEKGGTREKVEACEALGIKAVIIGRDDESGYNDLKELETELRKLISRKD